MAGKKQMTLKDVGPYVGMYCYSLSTLSQKSETVSLFCDSVDKA